MVYIVSDHQNKPRLGIDASTQQIVWSWDSDAYGVAQPSGSVKINLRFPGQYYDGVNKLYYNHNRYYNPMWVVIWSLNRLGLSGLNPCAYAGNNPVNNVDPSGLQTQSFGQWIDNNAMRSAEGSTDNSFNWQLHGWSLLGVTNNVFGSENLSLLVAGQITSSIGLGIEASAVIPLVGPAVKIGKAASAI